MEGRVVGNVVASKHPEYREGDIILGPLGWQEYAVSDGRGVRKVDPTLAPISTALGVLGMPGMTAYFGLLEVGRPKPGETVVVSGAAGAVGSLVGQIAKIGGCRVVGIAGSDNKVDYVVNELGFDAAFNYKAVKDYYERLKELCPNGIDVYFDNVGGAITDSAFRLINLRAGVVICGQISQYNLEKPEVGPRFLWQLIMRRARVEGFLVGDFSDKYDEGIKRMAEWIRAGKLKYSEEVVERIENAPEAFIGMLKGKNIGKQLVKVS
jgi:NADPH-dependent curcumin reductase CurA